MGISRCVCVCVCVGKLFHYVLDPHSHHSCSAVGCCQAHKNAFEKMARALSSSLVFLEQNNMVGVVRRIRVPTYSTNRT